MTDFQRSGALWVFLALVVSASAAFGQSVRPDEYVEQVKKEYLEPKGIDYAQLDEITQARVIGYALGRELIRIGMDYEEIERVHRLHYMFLNRLGRRSEAAREMNLAYLGRYDAEMWKLTGVAPFSVAASADASEGGGR